ncbi:hypothetical protein BAY61_24850 [Prauserella marina]|uniref:DNA-binding transcriptional activator of the SARP family n=1 Tax=Prauserella marina TaxID=530584 RepID=A0A222VUU6_9PSEU|nr:AfsR/SARP family transcriptional regulator [Prauserella marina]ASR37697.1 hypothetical protein BAY61_24850 [Prauserella marina]PWV75627.1 DNA-binding SARP family transcriptional activator [Prauserella marina]SDD30220.1 DNA-binding transcriptional activator of the SARP family [Prauserella marina]
MEFRVLGSMTVTEGGRSEEVTGRLRRVLLGVLLARANRPVRAALLAGALWGEAPEPGAGRKLHLHIHRLRGMLDEPGRLSSVEAGYRLRVATGETDADRFEALVEEARRLEPKRAIEPLRAALALWRGEPFAGIEVPELADWSLRLAERRLVALEALYEAELACGLHEAVIGELSRLAGEHALRERFHGLLMTALSRAGRRAEALDVYRAAREKLVTELGVEPGAELRELHRRVLEGDLGPAVAGGAVPAQLPADVPWFVGRAAELAELGSSPEGGVAPVLAVVGTAGAGKTALAVRWAHAVRDRFPDGELYVDLRGFGPGEPVSPADALAGFLRALGVERAAIPDELAERAALFRSLADKRRMLVLLDNAHGSGQVRPLLPAGAATRTLITSRDSLGGLVAREGAHRIGLDRLPVPDARRLLRVLLGNRADAEPGAVRTLVGLCARLPSALRVAAELIHGRSTRGVGDLVDELAKGNVLDLLDAHGDQDTAFRTVFSWSYRRLDPVAARVFRLLGRYREADEYEVAATAGMSVSAAGRVLTVLVRAHLVDQTPNGGYRLHELLRAYAAELGEADLDAEASGSLRAFDLVAP